MITGFANGCFDLLHEGHLYFLGECAKRCDYLIVAVNTDRSVARLKGDGRPVQSLEDRIQNIRARASDSVDAVIPFEGREDSLIMEMRPDVVFKGYDHAPELKTALFVRVPGWKTATGKQWDTIPIIAIDQLAGHSTTLQLETAKAKRGA